MAGDAGLAAIAKAAQVGIQRYIADTGCGINLVPMDAIKQAGMLDRFQKLKLGFNMSTAGGRTKCDYRINIAFPSLSDEALVAHVLDDTPPVVSIGRLCM